MKVVAIGLAAAALAASAFALTTRVGGQGTGEVVRTTVVTTTSSSPTDAVSATPAVSRTKPSRSVAHVTPVGRCRSDAGDEGDPTGDDSAHGCRSDGENDSSGDDRTDNDPSGDDRTDRGGDNQAGDNKDSGD